jgi:hypothetical protein
MWSQTSGVTWSAALQENFNCLDPVQPGELQLLSASVSSCDIKVFINGIYSLMDQVEIAEIHSINMLPYSR